MKYMKLVFPAILPIFFLAACSGNNSTQATKDANVSNSTSTSSSASDARFSCTVDGQPVSGGAADQLKIYNIATINEVDEGKELLFYLNDAKTPDAIGSFTHALRFSIPCKTGPVSFGHAENGWGIQVDIQPDKNHMATYLSDTFTVNVTKISPTNATGTFSGKFDIRDGAYSAGYKKEIEVTDGKFDVPIRN